MAHRELVSRCWGCNEPLPGGPFAGVQRIYHDEECRALHKAKLDAFQKRCPELPGWGRSLVRKPAKGDVLRVVKLEAPTGAGRFGVRFVEGPARAEVVRHHGRDTLPLAYYVSKEADEAAAADFLRRSYPFAEVQSLS